MKIDKWPKAFKMQNDLLLLCLTQLLSELIHYYVDVDRSHVLIQSLQGD